jgi:protein-S-isoprenylcysteine O-methyltransferase Ste14
VPSARAGTVLHSRPLRSIFPRSVLVHTAIFCVVNVLALIRWGHPEPWSRLDRYSITAILLLVGMGSMKARVHGALGPEISRQFFGERFDPLMQRLRKVMRLGDLLTLLDYGSGPLVPSIAFQALQVAGLVIAPLVMVWLWYVDSYLIARFPATLEGAMMQDGPFRYIRHPRYIGLLLGRFAFAAMLGSAIGWVQCAGVIVLFTRRMLREEQHLRATFPGTYDAYIQRTGRVFPSLR